jgi:hypothetical protein
MSVVRTVAEQIAEVLAGAGVKRIYGIVGGNRLTDATFRQNKLEWIYVRHEEAALFAAGAEAHLNALLAVCAGSRGAGDPHSINVSSGCHLSSIPVLEVVAHVVADGMGSGYFHETHPQTLLQECTHDREFIAGVLLVVTPGDLASRPTPNGPLLKISALLASPSVTVSQEDLDRPPAPETLDSHTVLNSFVEHSHGRAMLVVAHPDRLVDVAEYLRDSGWAINPSKQHRTKIHVAPSAETLPLEIQRCWLLALVIEELVANAVRYACFAGTREGKISIELTWEGNFVHCAVSDNGLGMGRARPVRGLRIAHGLARSLGGRIGHWFDDEGTSFVVTFPFTERELQESRRSGSRHTSASH